MSARHRYSRRRFLAQSAVATLAASPVTAYSARLLAPNERVNLAAVGVGGKGWTDITNASEGHNVVAFCDVEQGPTSETRRIRRGG